MLHAIIDLNGSLFFIGVGYQVPVSDHPHPKRFIIDPMGAERLLQHRPWMLLFDASQVQQALHRVPGQVIHKDEAQEGNVSNGITEWQGQ